MDGTFAVAGAGVFLDRFEVAFFLQGDQGLDVAVEIVNIADRAFEGFDFVAQRLHGTSLGLQAAVDALDLFEQVVAFGSDLFGGFTGHGLDHGFGFFECIADACFHLALDFGLFALLRRQAFNAAVDGLEGFETGVEVHDAFADGQHHGVELVDAAVHAHAHDQKEDEADEQDDACGAEQDDGFFVSDFGQCFEVVGGFVQVPTCGCGGCSRFAGDVCRVEHDLRQRFVLLEGTLVYAQAAVRGGCCSWGGLLWVGRGHGDGTFVGG